MVQVLAPALVTPVQPEQAVLLRGLLSASADILAAVSSQPAWQELHSDVAGATMSAISICAVSFQCLTPVPLFQALTG